MERNETVITATPPAITAEELLRLALTVGEGMLKSGGEVHEIEETVEAICRAYGANHVDVFVVTSLMQGSVWLPNEDHSMQIRRIFGLENDLQKQDDFYRVAQTLCQKTPPLDEAKRLVREVRTGKPPRKWKTFLGYALTCGSFAVFFGGGWRDGLAGALIGLILAAVHLFFPTSVSPMIRTAGISLLSGLLAKLAVTVGVGQRTDMVIIGAIMVLIPGVAFGTAIHDMLCGDLLTGILRLVQSCISALMIAVGFFLALLLTEGGLW